MVRMGPLVGPTSAGREPPLLLACILLAATEVFGYAQEARAHPSQQSIDSETC
jgi:hypothetical protein